MQGRGKTYILAGVPCLTIRATSGLDWAVSRLVVGITAFRELSMVRGEMLVAFEALLRLRVSVSVNTLFEKNLTYPG